MFLVNMATLFTARKTLISHLSVYLRAESLSSTPSCAQVNAGWRSNLYRSTSQSLHAGQLGLEVNIAASISRCCSMVNICTPYTFSCTSSLMVRGVSQNTLLGPRDRLDPPTVSSMMLWMAGSAASSEEQKVTQTVRESGTTGRANCSWSMQPCNGHGGGTRPSSMLLWGLQVRTLGSHIGSASGGPAREAEPGVTV